MADFLIKHKNLSVEIGVFDEGTGEELAFIRAKTLYESLVSRGIPTNRLLYGDYSMVEKNKSSTLVKTQLKIVSIR